MMKLFFILLVLVFSASVFATWDNTSYRFRFSFNVTAPINSSNWSGVQITLNSSNFAYGNAQSLLYDTAVYCDSSRDYLFNASINTAGNSMFFFKPPYTQNPQCYFYYGNASVAPQFNGQGVFKYFTDFNYTSTATMFTDGWSNYTGGNWNLTSNNTLNISATGVGGVEAFVHDSTNFTNVSVYSRMRLNQKADGGDFMGQLLNFNLNGTKYQYYRDDTSGDSIRVMNVTLNGAESILNSTGFIDTLSSYYVLQMGYFSSNPNYQISSNVLEGTVNGIAYTNDSSNQRGGQGLSCYAGGAGFTNCEYDWLGLADNNASVLAVAYNFGGVEAQNLSSNWITFNVSNQSQWMPRFTVQSFANFSNFSAFDTVKYNFNGVNYTPTAWNSSSASAVYNFNISGLAAGTYQGYWYANETDATVTQTAFTFVVSRNTSQPTTLLMDGSPSSEIISPGTSSNATIICGEGNANLYRDTANPTLVNSSNYNVASEVGVLASGVNIYVGECAQSTNYTTKNSTSLGITVSSSGGTTGGGGGGSPPGASSILAFSITPSSINKTTSLYSQISQVLVFKNLEQTRNITVSLNASIGVKLSKTRFTLQPSENDTVTVIISASESTSKGTITANLLASDNTLNQVQVPINLVLTANATQATTTLLASNTVVLAIAGLFLLIGSFIFLRQKQVVAFVVIGSIGAILLITTIYLVFFI